VICVWVRPLAGLVDVEAFVEEMARQAAAGTLDAASAAYRGELIRVYGACVGIFGVKC
jgi:hypothetical protein